MKKLLLIASAIFMINIAASAQIPTQQYAYSAAGHFMVTVGKDYATYDFRYETNPWTITSDSLIFVALKTWARTKSIHPENDTQYITFAQTFSGNTITSSFLGVDPYNELGTEYIPSALHGSDSVIVNNFVNMINRWLN